MIMPTPPDPGGASSTLHITGQAMAMDILRTGLNRDSVFGYACNRCLVCCRHKTIQLNPYEIARLARNRKLTTTEFMERYTDSGGTALRFDEDGTCVFLDAEGCGVHADRPLVCRLYPLGRHVSFSGAERFSLIRSDKGCRGMFHDEGTVRTYLEEQGAFPFMDAADRYLDLLWHLMENLEDLEPDSSGTDDVLDAGGTGDHEDPNWNDTDRVLAAYCGEKGLDVPESPEERMILHIEVVRGMSLFG